MKLICIGQKQSLTISGKELLGNGSIAIQGVSESDAGVYVCIAQNSAGTAFGQIRLRVFSKSASFCFLL